MLAILAGGSAVVVLWFSLIQHTFAPETWLDASWQLVLVHAHASGWQFGREVIFTWGPWGFLQSQFHLGETGATAKLWWEIGGRLGMAAGFLILLRGLPVWRQAVAVGTLVLVGWLFLDSPYVFFIVLVVWRRLLPAATPLWEKLLWLVPLAFFGQFKFTYTVLAGAGIGAAVLLELVGRRWRHAALLATVALAAYAGTWLAAGQELDLLVPFLRRSLEITGGYADAMGSEESPAVFFCGLATAAGLILALGLRHRSGPGSGAAWVTTGYLAFAGFVAWKHGFTRADGHVMGFFIFALLLLPLLQAQIAAARLRLGVLLFLLPALLGIHFNDPTLPPRVPAIAQSRVWEAAKWVLNPAGWTTRWQNELTRAAAAAKLPEIRARVGPASIDNYNYEQAVLLLGGYRFRPRPVFQSYTAYTPRLTTRNLRFYQSPEAPDFLLWKQVSIDSRYPTLDDAMLIPELPGRYEPVLDENGFSLLQRRQALPGERRHRESILIKSVRLGEEVVLPAVRDRAVWLQGVFPLSKIGRLRALLYKPPPLYLVLTEDSGRVTTWRVLPRIASDGFLLQPLVEDQGDFAAFLQGRGNRWGYSLRFTTAPGQEEFWAGFSLWFYTLPELRLANGQPNDALVRAGVLLQRPEEVITPHPAEIFRTAGRTAAQLHAPARVTFAVPAGEPRFGGTFGLREGAYTGDARTDGVEFEVEARWTDGRSRSLWKRHLRPLEEPGDRGSQSFSIALPEDRPAFVVFHARSGPAADESWDWSYVSALGFTP